MQTKNTISEANFYGVYILTNPSFKEYVKIGKTEKQTIAERVKDLNRSSAVPFSFTIYATLETDKAGDAEESIFEMLKKYKYELRARERTASGKERVREFFLMEPEEAFDALRIVAIGQGLKDKIKLFSKTKEEVAEEKTAIEVERRARAARFSFDRKGIKPGTIIEFLKDSRLTAKVVDEKYIEYQGEIYTLTRLAKKFLNKDGVVGEVGGPRYFKLNGIVLANLPDTGD